MERETIEIITPNKHKIVLKSYITGLEERQIREVFLEKINISATGEIGNIDLDSKLISQAEDKTIEILVISIDGSKENIVNKIVNLPKEDYNFIIKEINKITEGKKKD